MPMRNKTLLKIIAFICCFFFLLSLVILVFNLHFHVIGNSFLISHSHPYDKSHAGNSPIKSHQHSQLEFLVYYSVVTNDGLILFVLLILIFSALVKYFFITTDRINHDNLIFLSPILRAPPVKFSFIN